MKTPTERFEDKSDSNQIHKFLDDDGVERERHEYDGPEGHGFIDYEYKDGMMRSKHNGPEKREDTNWEWVKLE